MDKKEVRPTPEFLERVQLWDDTLNYRKTDHVPIAPMVQYLPMYLYNMTTVQDVMMDYGAAKESYIRYHQEFQPDFAWGPQSIFPGAALDTLDCQFIRWPGKHLSDPNAPFQVVDKEDGYMAAEEYLEYAEDPTGFIMRKILPRHYKALQGLEMVDFSNAVWQGGMYGMIPCALPPVKAAFRAMSEAGEKMMAMAQSGGRIMQELADMGWPSLCDQGMAAPFDIFNDTLRGFLNTTMDMIECPDELLAALETCTKIQVRSIKNTFATQPFCKNVVFFIHNGFDMFMSREQFQTFYWPGLKACIEAVIQCGGIPHIYLEDKYDSKMDIFADELPAGKCIFTIINCDVERTKMLFQGKIALSGGLDGTLLRYGTPEQVAQNVKDTIDLWAPGGGYLMNCDVSLDGATAENLHVMFDTARNYMKY